MPKMMMRLTSIVGGIWKQAALLTIAFCFYSILGSTLSVRVETLDLLIQDGHVSSSLASNWVVDNLSVPGSNGVIVKNIFMMIWLSMFLSFLVLTATVNSSIKLQLGVLFAFTVFNSISAIFGYILYMVTTSPFFPSRYIMGSSDSDITSLGMIIMWTNYLLIVAAGVLISYIVIRSARRHKRL